MVNISELKIGDLVWSYNVDTDKLINGVITLIDKSFVVLDNNINKVVSDVSYTKEEALIYGAQQISKQIDDYRKEINRLNNNIKHTNKRLQSIYCELLNKPQN